MRSIGSSLVIAAVIAALVLVVLPASSAWAFPDQGQDPASSAWGYPDPGQIPASTSWTNPAQASQTAYAGATSAAVPSVPVVRAAPPVQAAPIIPTIPVTGTPAAPFATGKSILVSLSHQREWAFQDGKMVQTTLVSTGLPSHPTVLGTYHIYIKLLSTLMVGPGYHLPNVPYTMYFYEGYGLHGTYWHHNFGHPMSHGCVNLPTPEAQWLFNWAPVGTPVTIVP